MTTIGSVAARVSPGCLKTNPALNADTTPTTNPPLMMSNKQSPSSDVGFASLLCLLFIGLKLGGVIVWSWWWVLSPIWIQFILIFLVALIVSLAS